MPDAPNPTYFFIHVMKTGGTTFDQHIRANFRPEELYPVEPGGPERVRAYFELDRLRSLTPEQRGAIKMYVGHFPYVATTMIGTDPITLTMLRDPVDRTVSLLRHRKRYVAENADMTLEEIYEDGWVFPLLVHNYQVRLFALTADDAPKSYHDEIDVDDDRLEIAKANLRQVDVLGLTECHHDFVAEVRDRFGWRCDEAPDQRVSTEGWDVSAAFRERIAADNAADVAFYEFAVAEHGRRRQQRSAPPP